MGSGPSPNGYRLNPEKFTGPFHRGWAATADTESTYTSARTPLITSSKIEIPDFIGPNLKPEPYYAVTQHNPPRSKEKPRILLANSGIRMIMPLMGLPSAAAAGLIRTNNVTLGR